MDNRELRQFYFGAYRFEETSDGFLQAFQYTKAQEDYFRKTDIYWYERCTASNAKTLEFITAAEHMELEYRFAWRGSEDTAEVWVNSDPLHIFHVSDMEESGKLSFDLPAGADKYVVIYLPADATLLVRNYTTDAPVSVPDKKKNILWMGDSITQGYGPLRSSMIYVSVANRELNYNIENQGIGGYIYDRGSVMEMPGYHPDEIVVALGTNQFDDPDLTRVEWFYERLKEVWGDTIPVTCITPVWRTDIGGIQDIFIRFCEGIKKVCLGYGNITVIDGFDLIPHEEKYLLDGLHPNEEGTGLYGKNLAKRLLTM